MTEREKNTIIALLLAGIAGAAIGGPLLAIFAGVTAYVLMLNYKKNVK